ncbi:hypothetical protein ACET3Z_030842 [Daucus carota]
MSATKYDNIQDLQIGSYDYKIRVRVIRLWRGATRTGEQFKNFNVILLDNKSQRMHAWIPTSRNDEMARVMHIGNIYKIRKFTVQFHKPTDKFRCLRNDKQIVFTKDTTVQDMAENEVMIPLDYFDFYEHSQLKELSEQTTYLTGIIKRHEDFRDLENKHGQKQKQSKLVITDGSGCWKEIKLENSIPVCEPCNRFVPYPEIRYRISVKAEDATGEVQVILGDREVRTLILKRARQLLEEHAGSGDMPQCLKTLAGKDYSVVLNIKEMNISKSFHVYWASNICNGFIRWGEKNRTVDQENTTSTQLPSVQGVMLTLLPVMSFWQVLAHATSCFNKVFDKMFQPIVKYH